MTVRAKWLPGEMEDARPIGLVFAKRPWPGFTEAVQEYRKIGAEIVEMQSYDDRMSLELRRRIAEWIVNCASRDHVPFEQMQEAWNGLLEVGFSDHEMKQNIDAMKPISNTSSEHSFAEVEAHYRKLETEFMSRLQPEEDFFVPELKRRIAHAMFVAAHEHRQPFEVCRDLWNHLRPWDFGHLEIKCRMIRRYGECCLFNNEPEAGLVVVEPLLAELQHQVDTDTAEDMPSGKYSEEISSLQKLRNDLETIKKERSNASAP